ncbi:AraC family transcriptional regulator [Nocardia sp. NBC_01730]|uniref:AraC family transcriptional regulator n=1 Tax=Nocardia sp. NBC_01730 TaxID=2975998 RepID=UPI002E111A6A|nr:AraC family transcriptional regulator [Nocardia sp. NBC_01730]
MADLFDATGCCYRIGADRAIGMAQLRGVRAATRCILFEWGGRREQNALPLANHSVLRTRDVDEAREVIGRVLRAPHDAKIIGAAGRFEARKNAVSLGPVALAALDYGAGAQVLVTPRHTDNFYLVHIPLAGAIDTFSGRERETATRWTATMAQPHEQFMLDWPADSPMLLVWFDASGMESTLQRMIGQEMKTRLRFELGQDLTTPAMRAWLDQVRLAVREIDQGQQVATHPLAVPHLQDLMTTGFLLSTRHSYSEQLHNGSATPAGSTTVKQAVAFIHAHAAEHVTVTQLAAEAGVGVRALQEGFRRHLDTTPMAYLRRVRLEHARTELEQADPHQATVSAIALRWGFTHFGDFAGTYRMAYGERPSETLKKPHQRPHPPPA